MVRDEFMLHNLRPTTIYSLLPWKKNKTYSKFIKIGIFYEKLFIPGDKKHRAYNQRRIKSVFKNDYTDTSIFKKIHSKITEYLEFDP